MRIEIPEMVGAGDAMVVASVSGGKDSTALMLALREAGVQYRAVFADTGWEARETYEYLDLLREKVGPIDVVRPKRNMVESIKHRAGFPGRMQRWCTQELKLKPLRDYHDALKGETINAMGVRAAESESRAKMSAWVDDDEWGGWVWRPLLRWSIEDVLTIHHRHDVPVNPLYLRGHDRVGCYPCIFSRKEEIRLLAEHSPGRIEEIAALERWATEERARRNEQTPDRYAHKEATFFQTRNPKRPSMSIHQIVEWSRSDRRGNLPLLAPAPTGGCMRWGMCEAHSGAKDE